MIRVYYNDIHAIVGNEREKLFYHTTLKDARESVKGKKHSSSRKSDLSFTVESLLVAGWEEVK